MAEKKLNAEFIKERDRLQIAFLRHFDSLFLKLTTALKNPAINTKWKKPGWVDTWRYQGLLGLGRRLFTGTDPNRDNLTWRMANAQKEGQYNSLKLFCLLQEECGKFIEFQIAEDYHSDALDAFRQEVIDLLAKAMVSLYELGKRHGISPEDSVKDDNDNGDDDENDYEKIEVPPISKSPSSSEPEPIPTPGPIPIPPEDNNIGNEDNDSENGNKDGDEYGSEYDLDDLDDNDNDYGSEEIDEEIIQRLSTRLSLDKVELVENRVLLDKTKPDKERQYNATLALIRYYSTLSSDHSNLDPKQLGPQDVARAMDKTQVLPCLSQAGMEILPTKDVQKITIKIGNEQWELTEKQTQALRYFCGFMQSPTEKIQDWMLPPQNKNVMYDEQGQEIPPGELDKTETPRGAVMTFLLSRRFVPKGRYEELVAKHYKPNLWFAKMKGFPKSTEDYNAKLPADNDNKEEHKKKEQFFEKLDKWPSELNNDIDDHAEEAMLDLYIAVKSGDLFGSSPTDRDAESQVFLELMKALVSGPIGPNMNKERYKGTANLWSALKHVLLKKEEKRLAAIKYRADKKQSQEQPNTPEETEEVVINPERMDHLVYAAIAEEVDKRKKFYPRLEELVQPIRASFRTVANQARINPKSAAGTTHEALDNSVKLRQGEES